MHVNRSPADDYEQLVHCVCSSSSGSLDSMACSGPRVVSRRRPRRGKSLVLPVVRNRSLHNNVIKTSKTN